MRDKILLLIILLTILLLPAGAQKMSIEKFKRVKFDLLNHTLLPVDKKLATLDLKTDEKGFTFKADGKIEVKAEEGEGKLTLLAPHKTKFLVINHPDYGQLTWKVPGKGLRKKKHYQANLLTDKPGKEYKLSKQWVVFKVEPLNAILQVDSNVVLIRDGRAQFNLPLGKHAYRVESPFHEAVADTLEVTDSAKLYVPVTLQSFYSYLTVRTNLPEGMIYVDGQAIGKGEATSGRLSAGKHRLMIADGSYSYYDAYVNVTSAEKNVLDLTTNNWQKRPLGERHRMLAVAAQPVVTEQKNDSVDVAPTVEQTMMAKAPVTITAPDDSTEIWLNREPVAVGKWEGELDLGYYLISTRKNGLESKSLQLWVDDTQPKMLDMTAPMASYGFLNVHSNVIGAKVYVNQVMVGVTPCVVQNLPASKPCKISLVCAGYREKTATVTPIGNEMVDIELNMKRE